MTPLVPTISESWGIPKRKNYPQSKEARLRPLFTGQVFIARLGVALERLTWRYGSVRAGIAGGAAFARQSSTTKDGAGKRAVLSFKKPKRGYGQGCR